MYVQTQPGDTGTVAVADLFEVSVQHSLHVVIIEGREAGL